MTKEFETITQIVNLDVILSAWSDKFEPKEGVEILKVEHYVDTRKNKVIFEILVERDKK